MLVRLSSFWRNRGGNFSTLTAITFPVLLLGAGLTLNTGALFLQKRHQQKVTDLAAITAAANLTRAGQAALMTFGDNGYTDMSLLAVGTPPGGTADAADTIKVEPGRYSRDVSKSLAQRFTAGALPINAVRVSASKTGEIYFPTPVLSDAVIGTTAFALIDPEASFTIGSRVAKVDTNNSIFNAVLGGLLGTTLNLDVNDYNALLNAEVDAISFMDALAGELKLTGGSYREVLDSSASVGTLVGAVAKIPDVKADVRTALSRITSVLPTKQPSLSLAKLIDPGKHAGKKVGSGVEQTKSPTRPRLKLLELVNAAVALSSGGKQVSVGSGLIIPGLTDVTIEIAVGDPPKSSAYFTMGPLGTVVETAQTRIRIVAGVGTGAIEVGTIIKLPVLLSVKVPLLLDLAPANAKLTAASCGGTSSSAASVTIDAQPTLATMYIADVVEPSKIRDFTRTPVLKDATLVNVLNVVGVTAGNGSGVRGTIGNNDVTALTFNATQIRDRAVQTANTRDSAQTLTSSLLQTLNLNVEPVGLRLLVGPVVSPLLTKAAVPLDGLINSILSTLGVKLGSVDVWVNGVNCGRPVLVQ